jgi:zinc D-Ala-D-Ala carboxypeptidase|tara:strand:+ start:187 stop:630 length:444 start_codon:yes stop_codon:yes gene_type:complete
MIMASPHFSIKELTFSETAIRHNINNTPNDNELDNLLITAMEMENVRKLLGNNFIHISSGFRCVELNTLIGSKKTSSHVRGLACDFTARGYGNPNDIVSAIVNSDINYDQLILEYDSWVHISFCEDKEVPRKEALSINKDGVMLYSK